jgi:hypothetical protein
MDKIVIKGREYRVEANWRAITGYLKESGQDTLEGVANITSLSPSTVGGLMAACINEGERLEGRDARVTEAILDDLRPSEAIAVLQDFVKIYLSQVVPQVPSEPKKEEAL